MTKNNAKSTQDEAAWFAPVAREVSRLLWDAASTPGVLVEQSAPRAVRLVTLAIEWLEGHPEDDCVVVLRRIVYPGTSRVHITVALRIDGEIAVERGARLFTPQALQRLLTAGCEFEEALEFAEMPVGENCLGDRVGVLERIDAALDRAERGFGKAVQQ